MRDIPLKVDGVSTLPAVEFNELVAETENAITKAGIALSSGDANQLAKAINTIGSAACAYTDSGTANAKVLTPVGTLTGPSSYLVGNIITFLNTVANTGAVTVNVNGLGAVNLLATNGGALSASMLPAGYPVTAMYHGGAYRLIEGHFGDLNTFYTVFAATSGTDTGTPFSLRQAVSMYGHTANFYTSTGAANTYTLTPTYPAIASIQVGSRIRWVVNATNTGATTINVAGLGAQSLVFPSGAALSAAALQVGEAVEATWAGSVWTLSAHVDKAYPLQFARMTRNSNQTLTTATATVPVMTLADSFNRPAAAATLATCRIQPSAPGLYLFYGQASLAPAGGSGEFRMDLRPNGVSSLANVASFPTTATIVGINAALFVYCDTTNYVDMVLTQTSGSNKDITFATMACARIA